MAALVMAPCTIEQLFVGDDVTGIPRETYKYLGSLWREMLESLPACDAPFGGFDEQVPQIETV